MEKVFSQWKEPHDPPPPTASQQRHSTSLHSTQYKRQTLKDRYTKAHVKICMDACVSTHKLTNTISIFTVGEGKEKEGRAKEVLINK